MKRFLWPLVALFVCACNSTPVSTNTLTPSPSPSPSPTPIPAVRSAYMKIEAESYDKAQGTYINTVSTASGGKDVGSLDGGYYMLYKGLDFGSGANTIIVTLGVPAQYASQTLEFHLDSPSGLKVGALTTIATTNWTDYKDQMTALSGAKGVHDFYIVVPLGETAVGNMDYFTFTQAAAKMTMGLNLGGGAYWTSNKWNDVSKMCSGFFGWNRLNATPAPTVTYGANGYPTSDAECITYMADTPVGTYKMTWDGAAQITIPWAKSVTSTGPNSADVIIANNSSGDGAGDHQLYIQVHPTDPTKPFQNFHLWLPGQGPTSPMYRFEFIANIKNAGITALRTMGDTNTNTSLVQNWSDRVTLNSQDWSDMGAPWEAEIELAKEAGLKQLWVNVPTFATDDYVLQMAQLFHSTLPTGIEVMVEFTNESWNYGFGNTWGYCNTEANTAAVVGKNAIGGDSIKGIMYYDGNIVNGKLIPDSLDANGNPIGVTDQHVRAARACADRSYHIMKIWQSVYSDRPQDFGPIWAGQAGWTFWAQNGLDWVHAKYNDMPYRYLAIAPYFDYGWNNGQYVKKTGPNGTLQVSDVLQAAKQNIEKDVPTWIDSHQVIAKQYGLKLIDYEGDQSFYPSSNPVVCDSTDPVAAVQSDPSMGTLMDEYFQILNTHGVYEHFSFSYAGDFWGYSQNCKYGYWSVTPHGFTDTSSPKWASIMKAAKGETF